MKSQNNDTFTKNLKRKARRIKKELGVPHHIALGKAVQQKGFQNWENFKNQAIPLPKKAVGTKTDKLMPQPLTLPFYWINNSKDARPNAKVSIKDHQQLGRQLKELYFATEYNKRAQSNVRKATGTLDEWIQLEYTSREELADEAFFTIYYGDLKTEVTPWPDQTQKNNLVSICRATILLLEKSYHACSPLKRLTYLLEQAIKAINNWPVNKSVKFERKDKKIKNGTTVFIKEARKNGIVIQHDTYLGVITGYTDKGEFQCEREAISIPRKQPTAIFRPLRLKLPYGKWTLQDGTEILFNKDYCPLWLRKPGGKAESVNHRGWVDNEREIEFYFDESNQPWNSNFGTWSICENVLRDWKVENRRSELMKAFDLCVHTGSLAPMESKKEWIKILGQK